MHFNTYKKVLCGGMAVLMLAMTGCTPIERFRTLVWGEDTPAPTPTPKPQITVE